MDEHDSVDPDEAAPAGDPQEDDMWLGAGSMPTPDEEAAAERAKEQTDLDEVGRHYREYLEVAKDVPGEGRIPGG